MKTAIVFPGQGSQSVGMAKDFYDNFSVAKNVFEEVNDTLKKDLTKIMFEGPEDVLTDTANAQPAIMTASVAILEVIKQESGLDIERLCDCMAGHSLGEYTALCASKSITLSDTAKLLKIRGESFSEAGRISKGLMATIIGCSLDEVKNIVERAKLDGEVLEIANDNMVGQTVISGNVNSIDNAIKIANEMGVKKTIKLQVSGAFHSSLMEPATENMKTALNNVEINKPVVDIFANYTAEVEQQDNIKDNLLKQITGRVRWRETVDNIKNSGVDRFVEIGASVVMKKMISRMYPDADVMSVNSVDTLKEFIEMIK